MSLHYVNPDLLPCEGELVDYSPEAEKFIDWNSRKVYSDFVADSFRRLGDHKTYARIHYCGTDLLFRVYETGEKRLHQANFCRHRMCPMCAWRLSLKKYAQISQLMAYLEPEGYEYIFVTLTVKNCTGNELMNTINKLYKGYNDLFRLKAIKQAYLGSFRSLEVTYNYNADSFHPHIHYIAAVRKSYFTSRNYISTRKLAELWAQCMGLEYTPIIYVERVEQDHCNVRHAVAEIAKYAVKSSDYLIPYDLETQDLVIGLLNEVLFGRRLNSVRGVFRTALRALKLDLEDEDLVHTDLETPMDPRLEYVIEHYKWNFDSARYLFHCIEESGDIKN